MASTVAFYVLGVKHKLNPHPAEDGDKPLGPRGAESWVWKIVFAIKVSVVAELNRKIITEPAVAPEQGHPEHTKPVVDLKCGEHGCQLQ